MSEQCFFFENQGERGLKGVNGGGGPKGNRGRGVCKNILQALFSYSFCDPWMDFWMSDYRAMLAGQEQLEILAARG